MTTVFFEDTFDSAHWLPFVPTTHKCSNMHGHTYKVRLEVTGPVNVKSGWVIDYAEIKKAWSEVKALVDHTCINDIVANSTCENLASWIWHAMLRLDIPLSRIELRETANCGVIFEG